MPVAKEENFYFILSTFNTVNSEFIGRKYDFARLPAVENTQASPVLVALIIKPIWNLNFRKVAEVAAVEGQTLRCMSEKPILSEGGRIVLCVLNGHIKFPKISVFGRYALRTGR